MPNPCEWVDPFGLAATSKILNNLPSEKNLAEKKAAELLAGATSNTQRSKLPRAVSAVIDKNRKSFLWGKWMASSDRYSPHFAGKYAFD